MAKVCKKFDSISEIDVTKDSIHIQVRILRLWKVSAFLNPSETNSIEMVLIDDKGGKIHASVRKQFLYMFQPKLVEGEVYKMSNFSVVPQIGYYRTTLHPYKLLFQLKTEIVPVKSSEICTHGLSLTPLSEVRSHVHDYEFLVDVIGVMTGISAEREYVRDGKITKMVVLELTDSTGKCECALFGEYAEHITKQLGKLSGGLPVVVIQFAKVKIFRDQASLQNVINTTKIFVNPDIHDAEVFKNSIALHGIDLDTNVPMIGGRAKPPMEEEFLKMYPKKKVSDLSDMEEDGIFAVYGVVTAIVDGQEWWYPACKCHRAAIPDSGAYYCNGCAKHVFQITPRFKVKVEVSDGDATCVFVMFDADMSYMLEKSCAHFVSLSKVSNDGSFPAEFNALVGKKMLFLIDKGTRQMKTNDGTYRVKRVCADSKIIDSFAEEGDCFTPLKALTPVHQVESDDGLDELDFVEDSQPLSFMKNIIITPPDVGKQSAADDDVVDHVKRNLTEEFDGVAKEAKRKRLRRIKIEKESP